MGNNKDPAFLFYSSDFLTGTMFMSNEQVGMYIRLMCAQHQKGHLKEKDMLNICQRHDEDIYSKFDKDDDGLYFNKRLDSEINKRSKYSESRRNNRLSKSKKDEKDSNICGTHDDTYVLHMENENENENEDRNRDENANEKGTISAKKSAVFIAPNLDEVTAYCRERKNSVDPESFIDFYESKGWMIGKNKMKSWKAAVRTWEKSEQRKAINPANKLQQGLTAEGRPIDDIDIDC